MHDLLNDETHRVKLKKFKTERISSEKFTNLTRLEVHSKMRRVLEISNLMMKHHLRKQIRNTFLKFCNNINVFNFQIIEKVSQTSLCILASSGKSPSVPMAIHRIL